MIYLVDTDILVDHLRKRPGAADYRDSLGRWSYSIITAMELFAGADSKKEIQRLEEFLGDFQEVPLSAQSGAKGRDALIAATAITEGLTLATRSPQKKADDAGLQIAQSASSASVCLTLRARDRTGIRPCRQTQYAERLYLEGVHRAGRESVESDRLLDAGDVDHRPA
jgi:predicted nucleic acid-binding protein